MALLVAGTMFLTGAAACASVDETPKAGPSASEVATTPTPDVNTSRTETVTESTSPAWAEMVGEARGRFGVGLAEGSLQIVEAGLPQAILIAAVSGWEELDRETLLDGRHPLAVLRVPSIQMESTEVVASGYYTFTVNSKTGRGGLLGGDGQPVTEFDVSVETEPALPGTVARIKVLRNPDLDLIREIKWCVEYPVVVGNELVRVIACTTWRVVPV